MNRGVETNIFRVWSLLYDHNTNDQQPLKKQTIINKWHAVVWWEMPRGGQREWGARAKTNTDFVKCSNRNFSSSVKLKRKHNSNRRIYELVAPILNRLIILKNKHAQSKHKITFAVSTCAHINLLPHKHSTSIFYVLPLWFLSLLSLQNTWCSKTAGIIFDWFWCVWDISSAVFVFIVTLRDKLCFSFRTVSACVHQALRSIAELREKCVSVCEHFMSKRDK